MMFADNFQNDPLLVDEGAPPGSSDTESRTIEGEVQIDLSNYISSYHGYVYYQRLFFIAQRCPALRVAAICLAHDYIKKSTLDITAYNRVFLLLAEQQGGPAVSTSAGSGESPDEPHEESAMRGAVNSAGGQLPDAVLLPGAGEVMSSTPSLSEAAKTTLMNVMSGKNDAKLVYDAQWEESTRRKGTILLDQLDTELKNYKANSIKESIRRGSDDLGDLYLKLGQLNNARKCYARSRDYCTSQQQEITMCLNVIKSGYHLDRYFLTCNAQDVHKVFLRLNNLIMKANEKVDVWKSIPKREVAIFQRAWSQVSAHVTRAQALSELREAAVNSTTIPAQQRLRTGLLSRSSAAGVTRPTATNGPGSSRTANGGSSRPGSEITSESIGSRPLSRQLSDGGSGMVAGGQSYRDAMASARTQLAIAAGLVELAARNFRGAALSFLQVNPDHCESPTSSIVTQSDLAYFVTLCSLATFDRTELASQVLSSPNVRLLLEAEPACRDMLQAFHQADYAACLGRLNKLRDTLRLDLFLADHVAVLCREIRSRALCQYFSPYSSADLNRMAKAFDTTVADLENELAVLIQEGNIKARIDSHKQLLRVLNVDQRCLTFARAMRLVDEYKKRTQAMVLRMSLARQRLSCQTGHEDADAAMSYMVQHRLPHHVNEQP